MGLKCLAELLSTLYHFNNINDVASKIVYSYLSEDKEVILILINFYVSL